RISVACHERAPSGRVEWTAGESNPDLGRAMPASCRWTSSPRTSNRPGRTRTCALLFVGQGPWPLDGGTLESESPRWDANPHAPGSQTGGFADLPTRRGVQQRGESQAPVTIRAHRAHEARPGTCPPGAEESPRGDWNSHARGTRVSEARASARFRHPAIEGTKSERPGRDSSLLPLLECQGS